MLEFWQWILVCLAALMVGISKTGIAGLSVLSVTIYTSILPPRESTGAVLLSLLAGDLIAVPSYWRAVEWPQVWRLYPWSVVGIVLGAVLMGRINDQEIRQLIGLSLLCLVLLNYARQWFDRRFNRQQEQKLGAAHPTAATASTDSLLVRYPWLAWLVGLSGGFATMIANASGPIMVLYLLTLRLPKRQFIGTAAVYYCLINLSKLPFSYSLGFLNPVTLGISLYLIPCTMLGAVIGRWILPYINQRLFEQTALFLTLIGTIRLLWV